MYSTVLLPELPSSAILKSTPERNQQYKRTHRLRLKVNNADYVDFCIFKTIMIFMRNRQKSKSLFTENRNIFRKTVPLTENESAYMYFVFVAGVSEAAASCWSSVVSYGAVEVCRDESPTATLPADPTPAP